MSLDVSRHCHMKEFIEELIKREDESIVSVIAFTTYNPSIGRVLEAGGIKKFQQIAEALVKALPAVTTAHDFDAVHSQTVSRLIRDFRTARGIEVSYGQAQKPINVFLKVYVDWAHRPSREVRDRLLPFLHVPLDSILMKAIKARCSAWYSSEIRPKITASQQAFSLSKLDQKTYQSWQDFFRQQYPQKPLVFDIAWAVNRIKT